MRLICTILQTLWFIAVFVAMLLLLTSLAKAQDHDHDLSLSLVGTTFSTDYAYDAGRWDIEADATHTSRGFHSHARGDYRRDWWVAGGEMRNASTLGHAGMTVPIPYGRADLSFTTRLGPRAAVEAHHEVGPILLHADAVWVPGQLDTRTGAQWRWLRLALWRVGGREWVPRAAVAVSW